MPGSPRVPSKKRCKSSPKRVCPRPRRRRQKIRNKEIKKSVEIFVIAVLLARPLALPAQTTPGGVGPSPATMPSALQNVGFEPQLGGQVPLDVPFEDESSRSVQLRDYFHRKPMVLAFVYYRCP